MGGSRKEKDRCMSRSILRGVVIFALALFILAGKVLPASAGGKESPLTEGAFLLDATTVTLRVSARKTEWSRALGNTGSHSVEINALMPFEYTVPKDRAPISKMTFTDADWSVSSETVTKTATFPLPENGLYLKYAVGGKNGENITIQYIRNPEILATETKKRVSYSAKAQEGLFANFNIDMMQYSDSYAFGTAKIVQFNNYGTNPVLKHPLASVTDLQAPWKHDVDKEPFQYMLNASDMEGVLTMANIMHGAASYGPGQDYIIGNEVNTRKWAYIAYVGDEQFIREYMQVFRVAYNAIKSADANARVFICLDHDWNRDHPVNYWEHYCVIDAKDFLIQFNDMVKAEGNIDWCLAYHPHLVPLTYAKFWDNTEPYSSLVREDKMVTIENLSVITDFLQQEEFLNTAGEVRRVLATEVTFSANQGADVQAAAVYAAYKAVLRNPYVETIVINQDPQEDINGIFTDKARVVFDNMDGPEVARYDVWARSVIGIPYWGKLLR